MNAQLLCRVRSAVLRVFDLRGDVALIGREPGLVVSVPMNGVSRRHAQVLWEGRHFWIEDLGSTNGTFLNGRRIRREKLRHLDVITLGKKADLIFLAEPTAPPGAATRKLLGASLVAEATGVRYDVPLGELLLGRSTACAVTAPSEAVSAFHARLTRTPDRLLLEDLGSSNGTFLNGVAVTRSVLRDRDVITLAGCDSYRVSLRTREVMGASVLASSLADLSPSLSEAHRARFSMDWKTRYEWDPSERTHADELPRPETRPEPAPRKPTTSTSAPVSPGLRAVTLVRLSGMGYELMVDAPGRYEIGRSREADLRIKSPTISRRQAAVVLDDEWRVATLEHLGGGTATELNGEAVEGTRPLADGDTLVIGEFALKVSIERG